MKYQNEEINWNSPEDYGLTSDYELEQTGYYEIAELLEIDDPQLILGVCTEDTYLVNDLIVAIDTQFKKVKEEGNSHLYNLSDYTKIVVSYYDDRLSAVSFINEDKEKVEKQLLSM